MPPLEPEPLPPRSGRREADDRAGGDRPERVTRELPELGPGELPPVGAPFCRVCDYDLSGCVDSSRCPECGRPLVEVLMRPEFRLQGGTRKQTRLRIMGMPAIDVALGPSGSERRGRARGFIAVGDEAVGVFAFGGSARGVVAAGGLAVGGISLGGTSVGVLSGGGLSLGLFANGGMALGGVASGGMGIGGIAQGGFAIGYAVRGGGSIGFAPLGGGGAGDPLSGWMAPLISWFLGGMAPSPASFILPMFIFLALAAVLTGLAYAYVRSRMSEEPGWEIR